MINIHFFDQLIKFYSTLVINGFTIYSLKKTGTNVIIAKTGFKNNIYPILGFIPKTFCYISRSKAAENIETLLKIKSALEDRDELDTIVQLKIRGNNCKVLISNYSLSNKVEFSFKFTSINTGF